jgi:peptidoglycan hydrolase-like protein with peptidoglycan-binding domain
MSAADVRFGIDIASYQAGENLAEVHGEGFVFVFVKATQGVSYVDPYYAGWAANPGSLILIPYHYVTTDSPAAQAAFFKRVVGNVPAVMLDIEHGSPTSSAGILAVIDAFRAEGYTVDIYLPKWFWEQIGSPDMSSWPIRNLIASDYPTTNTGYASALYPGDSYKGWDAYGNRKPTILQFTDSARVGGQLVDANAASPAAVFDAPTGTPTPPPPVVTPPTAGPAGWAASVKVIQRELNRWPFSPVLAEDGNAGPLTEAAVKTFQRAAGLLVDGVAGPRTYRAVSAWYDPNRVALREGITGPAVSWLQHELNRTIGANLTVDGSFGPKTLQAVKDFQTARGLVADGQVGKMTNAAVQI